MCYITAGDEKQELTNKKNPSQWEKSRLRPNVLRKWVNEVRFEVSSESVIPAGFKGGERDSRLVRTSQEVRGHPEDQEGPERSSQGGLDRKENILIRNKPKRVC